MTKIIHTTKNGEYAKLALVVFPLSWLVYLLWERPVALGVVLLLTLVATVFAVFKIRRRHAI